MKKSLIIMKKWIITVLMLVGIVNLVGCSDTHETVENMYIEPAQLTDCLLYTSPSPRD